tara:strand:+ start:408 stop:929 length:522 start_codon:yes stop_codon:yes gene_type:complete
MKTDTSLLVRPSTSGDIGAITKIYAESVLNGLGTFEIEPPDDVEMMARRNSILQQGLPYLVAERNGDVAGFAYANLYRPRAAYINTVEDSVYIAADMRGAGVGRALLSGVIDLSRQAGKQQMVAVIGDSGNRGSINLHKALGFRLVGIMESVGYKHDRWVDTVIMQKNLTSDD